MTTMRSAGWIASLPPGRSIWSPRMIAATFESLGIVASAQGDADHFSGRAFLDVELDDLHLPFCEHVGLACRRARR